MNWAEGLMVVIVFAIVIPGLLALILPTRDKRRFTQRDHIAARHRAIANRAVRTRAGIR